MSLPLDYEHVRPEEAVVRKDVEAFVAALSQHGVLRFLTDLAAALPHAALIVARGLNSAETTQAVSNLTALVKALARVPSEDFARFLDAVSDGVRRVEADSERPHAGDGEPPGLTGAYHLLQDDSLWQALGPLLNGLRQFGQRLRTSDAERDIKTPTQGPLL